MIDALQILSDNGLSTSALTDVVSDLIDNDDIDDQDEARRLVALAYYLEEGNDNVDPDDFTVGHGDIVSTPSGDYLVLTDDEADAACAEAIEQSLWSFNADFLASETGIDKVVFKALADKCEDANDAVRSIIDGSCGIIEFVDSVSGADGRGCFLAHYGGVEIEGRNGWYIYRVN